MKNIVKLGVILFLFTSIVSFSLAGLNAVTAPIIEQQAKTELDNSIKEIFPELTEVIENPINDGSINIAAYVAKKGDEVLGVVVKSEPTGFGGPITMLTGLDKDLKVVSVKVLSMSETAGLGTKLADPKFNSQYQGLAAPFNVVKGSASAEGDIVAITGATISSKAMTSGVNAASEAAAGFIAG